MRLAKEAKEELAKEISEAQEKQQEDANRSQRATAYNSSECKIKVVIIELEKRNQSIVIPDDPPLPMDVEVDQGQTKKEEKTVEVIATSPETEGRIPGVEPIEHDFKGVGDCVFRSVGGLLCMGSNPKKGKQEAQKHAAGNSMPLRRKVADNLRPQRKRGKEDGSRRRTQTYESREEPSQPRSKGT